MDFPHGETVVRLRGSASVDPYSGEATGTDWAAPDRLEVYGCAFDPGGSQEPLEDGRSVVITRPKVYAPADADILPGDRLEVRGVEYEIEGDPAVWRSPFTGWEPGMVVNLERVTG